MENSKAIWVRGNTQRLLIPLEQEIISRDGMVVKAPYYPDGGATVNVCLVGTAKKYLFRPTVDGNLLTITDDGSVPAGCYGTEVTVINQGGTRYRSYWPEQVVVTESNPTVLEEWEEFRQQDVQARAALFFFAKGDYSKPAEGIPMCDLSADVRTRLQQGFDALQMVGAVLGLIPASANNSNLLADKAFVRSAIEEGRGRMVGLFSRHEDLWTAANPAEGDYGYVGYSDESGNAVIEKYTYSKEDGSQGVVSDNGGYGQIGDFELAAWRLELRLYNNGFTPAQWDAIRSGIAGGDVSKLRQLPDAAALEERLAGLVTKAEFAAFAEEMQEDKAEPPVYNAETESIDFPDTSASVRYNAGNEEIEII